MNQQLLFKVTTYDIEQCSVFCKVKQEFGGFSNMSHDFQVNINGVLMKNTEALYQACRYPDLIAVQQAIITQHSGMGSKMKSKRYAAQTRADWLDVRVAVMEWCIRIKLAQNFERFGALLESAGDKPIVELSRRDSFWGAKLTSTGTLVGQNVLGKLLSAIRDEYVSATPEAREAMRYVEPPKIDNFLLLGQPIDAIGYYLARAA